MSAWPLRPRDYARGNVICDLDNDGNIVRKYLYGLGGKHLAMEVPSTQNWTYEDSRLNHQPEVAVVSDPQAIDLSALKSTKGIIPLYNCVSYGPYTPDQSAGGLYKVSYRLKIANVASSELGQTVLWLGATCDYGVTWLLQKQVRGTEFTAVGSYQEFEAIVTIPTGSTHAEYCVYTCDRSDVYVDRVTVRNMNATTYYYHDDYLGSPRVMTNSMGAVTWRQDYYAFGSDYNGTATGNTHKFTGHLQDGATGQYYAKARYFTTQLGRWSQPEPLLKGVPDGSFLSNPQKLNPYVYCLNNPLKLIDPTGLEELKALQYALDNLQGIPYAAGLEWPKNRDYADGEIPSTLVCNEYSFVAYRNAGHSDFPYSIADQRTWFENNGRFTTDANAGQKGDVVFFLENGQNHISMIAEVENKDGVIKYLITGARNSKRPSGYSSKNPIILGKSTDFTNFTGIGQINYSKKTAAKKEEPEPSRTTTNGNPWYWLLQHFR